MDVNGFETSSISEKLYQFLRDRIIFGEFAPGSRVDIKSLSQELKVSPQPVKEAIFRLTGEGFINIVPRKGTYIREASLKDLVDMIEARIFYETGAIDLLSEKIKKKDLQRLEKRCEEILKIENNNYKDIHKRNMAFHCGVVGLSGNRWLSEAYRLLMNNYASLHFRFVVRKKNYHSDVQQIFKDHRMIVDALVKKDFEGAKRIVRLHMQRVKAMIEEELFPSPANIGIDDGKEEADSTNFGSLKTL
jgi:DNA-binding GntR family transcriptional regulator